MMFNHYRIILSAKCQSVRCLSNKRRGAKKIRVRNVNFVPWEKSCDAFWIFWQGFFFSLLFQIPREKKDVVVVNGFFTPVTFESSSRQQNLKLFRKKKCGLAAKKVLLGWRRIGEKLSYSIFLTKWSTEVWPKHYPTNRCQCHKTFLAHNLQNFVPS